MGFASSDYLWTFPLWAPKLIGRAVQFFRAEFPAFAYLHLIAAKLAKTNNSNGTIFDAQRLLISKDVARMLWSLGSELSLCSVTSEFCCR
jgi:hypothetical protein